MKDFPRPIEHAFPLEATSIDLIHEKNVRHGHISTLHIWPSRGSLAACRAALIATLLPDPDTAEGRRELCEKIGDGFAAMASPGSNLVFGVVGKFCGRETFLGRCLLTIGNRYGSSSTNAVGRIHSRGEQWLYWAI